MLLKLLSGKHHFKCNGTRPPIIIFSIKCSQTDRSRKQALSHVGIKLAESLVCANMSRARCCCRCLLLDGGRWIRWEQALLRQRSRVFFGDLSCAIKVTGRGSVSGGPKGPALSTASLEHPNTSTVTRLSDPPPKTGNNTQ